jgi:plasmid stability protein
MAAMKTTLDLPDDLMREVKIRAVKRNRKLKEEIADLLRRGLSQRASGRKLRHRVTFPIVECAHEALPGEQMTPERVASVLVAEESGRHGPLR